MARFWGRKRHQWGGPEREIYTKTRIRGTQGGKASYGWAWTSIGGGKRREMKSPTTESSEVAPKVPQRGMKAFNGGVRGSTPGIGGGLSTPNDKKGGGRGSPVWKIHVGRKMSSTKRGQGCNRTGNHHKKSKSLTPSPTGPKKKTSLEKALFVLLTCWGGGGKGSKGHPTKGGGSRFRQNGGAKTNWRRSKGRKGNWRDSHDRR